jgi:single-strand selective monofunctional uracil DNA glycosylase
VNPNLAVDRLNAIYRALSDSMSKLSFGPPTTHVYNPLEYAWEPVKHYLGLAGHPGKEVLFLGMNPGPWGMAQTGVPFGTVSLVRDWMGISAPVGKPRDEHPRRPVLGFGTEREEVSGTRFWGWARDRFGTAEQFFGRFFVANYCPLVFMEESGRNRTPDKLPADERLSLFEPCDRALRQVVEALEPRRVIGVGKFAEDRARVALKGMGLQFGRILHPSPASPLANRGWAEQAEAQLRAMGVVLPAGN